MPTREVPSPRVSPLHPEAGCAIPVLQDPSGALQPSLPLHSEGDSPAQPPPWSERLSRWSRMLCLEYSRTRSSTSTPGSVGLDETLSTRRQAHSQSSCNQSREGPRTERLARQSLKRGECTAQRPVLGLRNLCGPRGLPYMTRQWVH